MATGDEELERYVSSGQVWSDFCDALKRAGEVILRERSPREPLDRAEGWRYLSRLVRLALEQSVESGDPEAPVLYRLSHETAKIGADNPDAFYQNAIVDCRHDYRLHGTRGSVDYIGFGTYSGVYGIDPKIERTGFLDTSAIEVDPDGRLEIFLSAKPRPRNWLPMREDTRLLIVRQFRQDWEKEQVARLEIECLTGRNRPAPLTPAAIARGLDDAARFVSATAATFADWAEEFARSPNTVMEKFTGLGDPNNKFWHGYWSLREGEALLIEAMPPVCEAWNFQLNNWWEESLDYRYFNVHVNKHTARYEDEGRRPEIVKPVYGDDHQEMLYAAKLWNTTARSARSNPDGRSVQRLNVFWPDRIERWFRPHNGEGQQSGGWEPWLEDGDNMAIVPWTGADGRPLGIPVFHLRHLGLGAGYGRSRLRSVVPFQDAINKIAIDLEELVDNLGLPERWAAGVTDDTVYKSVAGNVWQSAGEQAKFGQLDASPTSNLLDGCPPCVRGTPRKPERRGMARGAGAASAGRASGTSDCGEPDPTRGEASAADSCWIPALSWIAAVLPPRSIRTRSTSILTMVPPATG